MRSGNNDAIIATIKDEPAILPSLVLAILMTKQLLLHWPPLHRVFPRSHSGSGVAAAFCVGFRQKAHLNHNVNANEMTAQPGRAFDPAGAAVPHAGPRRGSQYVRAFRIDPVP